MMEIAVLPEIDVLLCHRSLALGSLHATIRQTVTP